VRSPHYAALHAGYGCSLASRSASAASSGVFTLKNGSTGAASHSVMATPWRAVHTSILLQAFVDQRVPANPLAATTGHSPTTGDGANRRRRAAAGERRARPSGATSCRAEHQIMGQGTGSPPARRSRPHARSGAWSAAQSRARQDCRPSGGRRNPARCRGSPGAPEPCETAPDPHWH